MSVRNWSYAQEARINEMIESGPHDAVTGVAARSVRARIERGAGNAFYLYFSISIPNTIIRFNMLDLRNAV